MKKLFFALSIFFVSASCCMNKNKKTTDLYLQAKTTLANLENLPADSKNILKLIEVQKKFKNTRILAGLDAKEIKQINTVLLPYIQQLIDTQKFFLGKKADYSTLVQSCNSLARNTQNDTILLHALRLKLPYKDIEYLLLCGQSPNDTNKNKENAFHIASSTNNKAILKLLLSYQSDIKEFFPTTDISLLSGKTFQVYEDFISSLTTPAQINAQDILGQAPLHKACIKNSTACTKILLKYNALPTIKDNNNKQPIDYLFERPWTQESALICQIFTNFYEPNELSQDDFYVDILEKIKKSPTENLKSLTPELKKNIESYNEIKTITIFQAIDKKILTSEIIKRNYDTINTPNEKGETPLCWCLANNLGYCQLLLEHKADPNKKSDSIVTQNLNLEISGITGFLSIPTTLTPLEYVVYASKNRSESQSSYKFMELLISNKLIKLLLQHGADPNSGKKFPPLHYMAELDSDKKISLLLDNKANIDMPNCFGKTALQIACQHNCYKSVVKLLCRDANPTIVNEKDSNKTALDYCYDKKHDTLIVLLLSFGATTQQKIFINGNYSRDIDHIKNFVLFNCLDVKISYDKNGKKGIYLESKN